ncbi:kinase-like domain-containing protein, partial [Rhexocercosporidium sp. MPI-PUGE-AT-0058]
VRDAKLQTSIRNDITHHVYYTSITSTRRRKVRVEEKWKLQEELGNGTYGRVWRQTCIQGPKYVHCFVQSFGWYENDHLVYITMEYMEHGDLQKRLGHPFPEPEVQAVALQLIEGLQFMHENGFTHRDLKPGNVLVLQPAPEWWVKIADFGISKRAVEGSTGLRTQVGTRGYLAPEVIGIYPVSDINTSGSADISYTSAVDMWALGEICFRMITNNQPAFSFPQDLFKYVTHGSEFPVSPLLAAHASHDSIEFIKITMDPSPTKRLSARDASSYPWIEAAQETARRSLSEGRYVIIEAISNC